MTKYHTPPNTAFVSIHDRAWALVAEAEDAGIILEIENVSCNPRAMGNTMMMVHMRPARIREKPIKRLDIQAMADEALERVKRRIAEQHAFERHEVSLGFDEAFKTADLRTSRAATQAMLLQGRPWPVKRFHREGWAV